jgi:ribosomal protein S14
MLKLLKFKKFEFNRKEILKIEKKKIIYSYINYQLIKNISAYNIKKIIINNLYTLFTLKYIIRRDCITLTRYKRFCFITKHNRTFRYFRLSRMCLKELISKGNILGIYKSS